MKGGSLFSGNAPSPSQTHSSPSSTPPRAAAHPSTFSEKIMEEDIDYVEALIRRWDVDSYTNEKFSSLFVDDRKEAKSFLEAVGDLQKAMHYYVKLNSSSEKLVRAHNLMQIAIKRLQKEFYVILSANRKNLESESASSRSSRASISDYYEDEVSEDEENTTPSRTPPRTPPRTPSRTPPRTPPRMPSRKPPHTPPRTPPRSESSLSEADIASDMAMTDLKNIADCMIASGYGKECLNIYKLIRKSIIDETLYYLGAEKLNHSQIQKMKWDVLEAKIKTWLHAFKIAVKTLFYGERILSDIVFSSSKKIAEASFTEISRDAAINIFTFPENFGKSKKILSPEKIFRALDLYEAISDLWPEIESVFSHESLSAVRSQAAAALVKLGEVVRVMLKQFETAIHKDSSKTSAGGGVHPLTRYVMNFLIFLGDYSGALSDIVEESPVEARSPLPESYFSSPTSGVGDDPSITSRFAWLILVLLSKLDVKAGTYNDVALSYLFLANNLNYVVSKVQSSSLGLLMGPEWIWKSRSKVNQYLANYQRMGWSKVTSSLPEDPTAEIPPEEVKQRFRQFYLGFEEAYKKQNTWVIPDPKLRDELKISIAKKIILNYRTFHQKHREQFIMKIGTEPIIKYTPEDLDNYVSDLFFVTSEGSSTAPHESYLRSSHPH